MPFPPCPEKLPPDCPARLEGGHPAVPFRRHTAEIANEGGFSGKKSGSRRTGANPGAGPLEPVIIL